MAEDFVTEEELVNGDPELSGTNYDEMLDYIHNVSGGRDPYYPNRPNVGGGDMMVDAEGNPIDPNAPGVDQVTAEYTRWLEEAAAYGVENLSIRDQILYAQAGYRAGVLTAEEAQAIYDPAFAQHAESMGWEWDAEREQWKDPNLRDQADGEKGFVDYFTPIDFADSNTGFDDFDGGWINSEWDVDREVVNTSFVSKYFKAALAVGASLISGGAAAGAMGGLSGWLSGALSGTIGSATGQLLVTGELDADSLFKAALLGATGGLFNDLSGMDASIFEDATGLTGAADDAVTALSDMLNIPYDQALNIAKGVVDGTIKGNDLEGIVAGAAASYTQGQVMDYLKDAYGDTVNVDDWFKDGESHIPVEALDPFVGQIIGGIADGSIDDAGAWAETLYNYFQAGGDVDFMLPGVPEGGGWQDWMSVTFPDIDFGFELPDINLPDVDLPDLPDVDLPDIDIDVPDLPDVDLPDIDIDVPDLELPDVDLDGPDVDPPDLPSVDIDLPKLEFRGSKPFGEDLKQFTPLGAPQLAQQTQIIPKAQFQGYDPRRSGSPIVASLFSEYLG